MISRWKSRASPSHEGGSSREAGAASSVGSEAVAGGSGGGGDQPSSWSRPAPTLSTASRSTRAARAAASAFSRIARTPISAPPPTSSSFPLAPQPTHREELGFQTTAGAPTAGERRRWSLRRSGSIQRSRFSIDPSPQCIVLGSILVLIASTRRRTTHCSCSKNQQPKHHHRNDVLSHRNGRHFTL